MDVLSVDTKVHFRHLVVVGLLHLILSRVGRVVVVLRANLQWHTTVGAHLETAIDNYPHNSPIGFIDKIT